MKHDFREELQRLRDEHNYISRQLERFARRMDDFEGKLDESALKEEPPPAPMIMPVPELQPKPAPVLPPPLPVYTHVEPKRIEPIRVAKKEVIAPVPAEEPVETRVEAGNAVENEGEGESFEMKLATYWFVRVGVVMLLTGLAFFGYYAYQKYIPHLGPWGKLGLIYLSGITMLLGGHWCQRDEKNGKLVNFGHVVFAGGLAAIYFATYAAHHIEYLRVIQNPMVDGVLLLLWATVVVWLADRRQSEVMALFAISLSYYTSGVTHVGIFTLVSNLILTLTAVAFFLRNRWATLSFISMIGTYFGYAYWRFYYGGWSLGHLPVPDMWYGVAFLACYWSAFCTAGFLGSTAALEKHSRAGFLAVNNFAFFVLTALSFWQTHSGRFWLLSLGFGTVLLVLSYLAKRRFEDEKEVGNSLLTQGLLLVTLGLIVKFSGLSLALLLAAETVALLLIGYTLNLTILRMGAYITAILSLVYCLPHIDVFSIPHLVKALGVGGAMLLCGCWTQRQLGADEDSEADIRLFFWSAATWLIALVAAWQNIDAPQRPVFFALLALLAAHAYPLLRLKELVVLGQAYLVLGQLLWLYTYLADHVMPSWVLASLTGCTVWMGHWWQHQSQLKLRIQTANIFQGLFAAMLVVMGLVWLQDEFALAPRIVWTAAVAGIVTVYALLTRWKTLAILSQGFVLLLVGEFMFALVAKDISSIRNLLPIAVLMVFAAAARFLAGKRETENGEADGSGLRLLAYLYCSLAALMSLLWIHQYQPAVRWFWVQALVGAIVFGIGLFRRERALIYVSLIYTAFGLFDYWRPGGTPVIHGLNLIAIMLLFAQQQALDRLSEDKEQTRDLGTCFITAGGLSLWFYIYRWLSLNAIGFYITAGWAALAFVFLVAGLILQDRRYRWLGIIVLMCAIARAMLIDVWKLMTIYRVLSFMALGIVLIVLSFIYNRYQEQIKKWL